MVAHRFRLLIGLSLFLLLFFLGAQTAFSATIIEDSIIEDTVWTASSSPYFIIEEINVAENTTLTIESGVVVKLRTRGIVVDGTLLVQGTSEQPVHITSYKDDSIGGDTNGDGTNSTPVAGDWQGIQFNVDSSGVIEYAFIRYSGYSSRSTPRISAIHNLGAHIVLRESEFAFSPSCGFGQANGEAELSDIQMDQMGCGVGVIGGILRVNNFAIHDSNLGVFSHGADVFEITDSTFQNVYQTSDIDLNNLDFIHSGNTASGGEFNGFLVRGTVENEIVLTPDSMPYIITSVGGSGGAGGLPYRRDNNLVIDPSGSLTFEPDAIVKMHDSARLLVKGTLNVGGVF